MKNTIIALALVASIAAASGQTKPAAKKARAEKECQTVKGSCCKKMAASHCAEASSEKGSAKKN
jgi:hypothetical protein